ncbi:hypothetical protein T03_11021 [Trichinella britovi]|uniref:Uncharacterized protein n=1 Tax=Trichinella britovi TaxID=45882 RepID=A0A0V1C5Q3_TRIBR|nr:hypothetical protein T03_11021 [Trichinella britovi]
MKSCRKSLSAVTSYLMPILQIEYQLSLSLRNEAKHQSKRCKFSTKVLYCLKIRDLVITDTGVNEKYTMKQEVKCCWA